jgi:hypothetical protein
MQALAYKQETAAQPSALRRTLNRVLRARHDVAGLLSDMVVYSCMDCDRDGQGEALNPAVAQLEALGFGFEARASAPRAFTAALRAHRAAPGEAEPARRLLACALYVAHCLTPEVRGVLGSVHATYLRECDFPSVMEVRAALRDMRAR